MEINKAVDLLDNLIGMVDDNQENDYDTAFYMAIEALKTQEQLANDSQKVDKENGELISNKRTKTHACDYISRKAAIDSICRTVCDNPEICESPCDEIKALEIMPSAQPEWNNHTVACLLADLFYDTCACNYNGIDEWLPEKCEVIDSCPNPVGVACWEQFLKHRAERRTDEVQRL